ncbi:MAG: hypothetical protein ACO25B_00480 [Chitinophagaceae bacterium]
MKRRVRKIANFFAFNLLFFALYLNFIHKDKAPVNFAGDQASIQQQTAAFGGPMEQTPGPADKKATVAISNTQKADQNNTAALKLSIN